MMRDHQLRRVNVRWNYSIAEVAELIRNIERLLISQVKAAGGHDRNRALRQFAIEGSEGNAFSRDSHKCRDQMSEVRYQKLG
jgi:hypothetical protein